MRHADLADDDRLLAEIRERAKNPARLDPRAKLIADGTITASRGCEGKKKYRTPEFALVVAKAVERRFGHEMVMYHCQFCSCYHLATKRAA